MKRYVLVHYSEIGLKKGNKRYFVDKLKNALRDKLQQRFKQTFSIKEGLSRILIPLETDFVEDEYIEVLKKIFGLKNFQFVHEGSIDIDELGSQIWENMPDVSEANTFIVRVKRSQKVPYTSIEAERELGAIMLRNGIDKKVKVKGADLEINVEVFNEHSFFSYKKYPGPSGLSVNSESKLVCLMSSGIDSPVAAYRMMRRGARIIFVHFHAYPYTDQDEMEHVKDLVGILSDYQFHTKLYLVPFGDIQKKISITSEIPAKVRVVMYRRMMIRIAERFAKKNRAKGLVTGDSYGQVASQTPENMFCIHDSSTIPIYQPLIACDKEEIVELAREIGTFDVSILPCKDTCSMFSPKHPELKANPFDLLEFEKSIDVDGMIDEAVKGAEIVDF